MKLIPLTQGQFAQVDDEDFDELNKFKWQAYSRTYKGKLIGYYAGRPSSRKDHPEGKQKTLFMHREMLKITDRKIVCDHIDRDGLNNQKHNLREATYSQNAFNRPSIGSSKYKGVSGIEGKYNGTLADGSKVQAFYPKWRSFLKKNGKVFILGRFPFTEEGEIEAAKAYDKAAREHFKEFAVLNFPEINE